MLELIKDQQDILKNHPVYSEFKTLENIRVFMEQHVYAVWDFMSLLKSLQRKVTCVEVPWKPSIYPAEMVRLVNQIVLCEESDLDAAGHAESHFDIYLKAMEEVGASTVSIKHFMNTMDLSLLPTGAKEFVAYNLKIAMDGDIVEVASSFFFGREKLIPEMFDAIRSTLKKENIQAPTLMYYLERHIEVDAEEHGPLAMKCLDIICEGSLEKRAKALQAGLEALKMRKYLWDETLKQIELQYAGSNRVYY